MPQTEGSANRTCSRRQAQSGLPRGPQLAVFVRDGARCVEDDEHEIGFGECFHRFLDADAFRFVECAADTCCIHELNGNAVDGDGLADEVAGGAGRGGDDGAFALHQTVEETDFPTLGRPTIANVRPSWTSFRRRRFGRGCSSGAWMSAMWLRILWSRGDRCRLRRSRSRLRGGR